MDVGAKVVESGLELLARLGERKACLKGIEDKLFLDGLDAKDTIEISGPTSSGKSLLLCKLIAKCLLPSNYKGCNVGVLLIDSDHHFQMDKLILLMKEMLRGVKELDGSVVDRTVDDCLNNFTMIKCRDGEEFHVTLNTLESIFLNNDKICLLAIDSVLSYYWEDREKGGQRMIDMYVRDILRTVQTRTFPSNIVSVYTKPDEPTGFECVKAPVIGKINYKIQLCRAFRSNNNVCTVESSSGRRSIQYTIDEAGLKFIV